MFYWLIPYLVAYNVSESVDWKYGPEHVFKVEVRTNITSEKNALMHSNVNMEISCRPRNSSLVQCQIESALSNSYVLPTNHSPSLRSEDYEDLGIGNLLFQVEFDDAGVTKITHFFTRDYFRLTMIKAIVDNFNVGMDLREKKFGNYRIFDKSVNGMCHADFEVKKLTEQRKSTLIEGYDFDIVALWKIARKESIVIVKQRIMDNCVKKTPYVFGQPKEEFGSAAIFKPDMKMKYDVTSSLNKMYLGRNSFSSYTENSGIIESLESTSSEGIEENLKLKIGESIRVSLEQIRPASEEL